MASSPLPPILPHAYLIEFNVCALASVEIGENADLRDEFVMVDTRPGCGMNELDEVDVADDWSVSWLLKTCSIVCTTSPLQPCRMS